MKLNLRRNLLVLAVLLLLAAQAQALEDTSFTVTLPLGYDQAFFNATSATQYNVTAGGQTSGAGFLNITNTGNVSQNFSINVTQLPSGVTLKANTDSNPAGATPITALTLIISNLGNNTSQSVWLWADFYNAAPMSQQRMLIVNSSTYI